MRRRIIFHCPACGTDRVGDIGAGRWKSWLRDDNFGFNVSCTGCELTFHGCTAVSSVTGMSYRSRATLAARSFATYVAAAGDAGDPRTVYTAMEMVRTYSRGAYSHADYRLDVRDPLLKHRWRGDLVMLAVDLQRETATQFLQAGMRVADACGAPTPDQWYVLEHSAKLLGADPPELFESAPAMGRRSRAG